MAKKLKYDTEHFDFIVKWLDKEVKKIQKEIDTFGYVKIDKPADVYTYPESYIASKVGGPTDYLLMKMDLSVSHITFEAKGYKKEIPWFFVAIDNHYKDLYLHPEDINKSVKEKESIVQLRPFNDEIEKRNFMEYRMPVEARAYLSERINKVYDEIRAYMEEHYGTTVKLGAPKYMGVKSVTDYFEKGKPEQYYEYFTNLIKRVGKDSIIGKHYRKHALEAYGLTLTDKDIDNAEGKSFDELSQEQKDLYAKQREEEKIKKEEEEAKKKKMIEDFTDNKSVKKEKKMSRSVSRLLDDILGDDVKKEKRKKKSSGNWFSNLMYHIATPFVWLGEKIAWCAKKVWSFILFILDDIWTVISFIFRPIVRGIKGLCKSLFYGVDSKDLLFTLLPTIIMIVLAILSITDLIKDSTWAVKFNGSMFGYSMELSGLIRSWMKSTDYNFFIAITVGLIQIILIVLLFIADLLLHILLFVLALLWCLIQLLIQVGYVYILPVLIPVYLLIRLVKHDDKALTGLCFVISLGCSICYFILTFM